LTKKHVNNLLMTVSILLLILGGIGRDAFAQNINKPGDSEGSAVSFGSATEMFEGLDAREAMALANKLGEGKNSFTSFVTPESVIIEIPGGGKFSIPLPEDRMVVAIAPYVKTTHNCAIHYMSGCKGELINKVIDIEARDNKGKVIIAGKTKTMSNGFIELWLPREAEIYLTMVYNGKKSTGMITTYFDSNTCITNLQLK
jgi:hypothetical protein